MAWFYNSYSGELTHATGIAAIPYEGLIHSGIGWHQLRVPDSATEAQAAADAVKEVPGGTKPTTSIAQGAANVPAAAAQGIPGLSQIGDFFGALGKSNTWIRVAKVLFGGVLLVVGIAHITGASSTLADTVRKVPLPV